MKPISLTLYRLATRLAEPTAQLVLRRRARRGKEDPSRLTERLGRPSAARSDGVWVWMHAASVGESLSLLPLVMGIGRRRPEVNILVTSGTLTSARLLRDRLPPGARHQFAPVDGPQAVSRFLDHWRPDVGVFVESELWPNLIVSAHDRGVRLALLSARFSAASLANWRRVPASARHLFKRFSLVMAQDDEAERRLCSIGARSEGILNLKRLAPPPPADPGVLGDLKKRMGSRPMILAASTHPGEEELVLAAFAELQNEYPDLLLTIAPRHPERGSVIAAAARSAGFNAAVRSAEGSFGSTPVYIADTLGELGLWYGLARAAFIGGSLAPGPGGHNPVEPAQLNCPIIVGPHLENWRSVYADLEKVDGVTIAADAPALAAAFYDLLKTPARAQEQARRALEAAAPTTANLEAALDRLEALLP